MELASKPHVSEEFDHYRRSYNDETTWLAEVLDGSMRTPFEYSFDGVELYADDGSPLGRIFKDALDDAHRLQKQDSRLTFEVRRRSAEQAEYQDMLSMMHGELPNTMVVLSDFPSELMEANHDVGGYNVTRKQTMLRILTRQNGRLRMFSQTLDGSNRQALEAVYGYFGMSPSQGELLSQRIHTELSQDEQRTVTDQLVSVYDTSMQAQYGGFWRAGRQEDGMNTYQFVLSQHDVVDHFIQRKMRGDITDTDRYNLAALMSRRYEIALQPVEAFKLEPDQIIFAHFNQALERQLEIAGDEARSAGKSFSGCGISVGASEQLTESGYGNASNEDKYGSLTFKCKNGHTNVRPRNKLITSCWVKGCKDSVAC